MHLKNIEEFLAHGRIWTISILLLLIALLKSGVAFEVAAQNPQPAFPMPEPGIAPTSFGLPALVEIFQLTGNATAIGLMMFALTAIALSVFAFQMLRSSRDSGLVLAGLVLLGPIGVVAFGNVGRHDWFLLVGSLLFALKGSAVRWALVSSVLMVLGNPEQALLAVLALLVLSGIPKFRRYRRPSLCATAFVSVAAAGLTLWVELLWIDGRASWLGYHLVMGLQNFFVNLPLSIYAAYGAGWILVIALMLRTSGRFRAYAFVALVAIPLGATAITFDQTRVFVGVSVLVSVVVYREMAGASVVWLTKTFPERWRVLLLGILIILPAIEITYAGIVRPPYEWLFDFIGDRM